MLAATTGIASLQQDSHTHADAKTTTIPSRWPTNLTELGRRLTGVVILWPLSAEIFDKKFGPLLVAEAPAGPGVYRYFGPDGELLYVGKAKNLRRRLSNYRNAGRQKVHRKMRRLVKAASILTYEVCDSELSALLKEAELIRSLKPPFNVDGAFDFLYPSIGLAQAGRRLLLCFSTQPEAFDAIDLQWFGCFRSRPRVKQAFDSLTALLAILGHREKRAQLPPHPDVRGSYLVAVRQLPEEVTTPLPGFLAGRDRELLGTLAHRLLDKPQARREAAEVQQHLRALAEFFEADACRLSAVLDQLQLGTHYIPQAQRDELFIRAKHASER